MTSLTEEIRNVQNPALGAVLLWRFACGFSAKHTTSGYPPIQELFIVLPMLFHKETFELLKATNRPSGLHGFADKFSRTGVVKSDVLLGIQTRAVTWRQLTLESLRMSMASQLLTISTDDATAIPLTTSNARLVPQSVKSIVSNADKLGEWCAALTLFEVGTVLKVGF